MPCGRGREPRLRARLRRLGKMLFMALTMLLIACLPSLNNQP